MSSQVPSVESNVDYDVSSEPVLPVVRKLTLSQRFQKFITPLLISSWFKIVAILLIGSLVWYSYHSYVSGRRSQINSSLSPSSSSSSSVSPPLDDFDMVISFSSDDIEWSRGYYLCVPPSPCKPASEIYTRYPSKVLGVPSPGGAGEGTP